MKVIIINGSPRKGWNTDLLLKEAQKGAESVGAETEYIDLYDLTFTGCKSCFACKVKGGKNNGHCVINDDLKPVLQAIDDADAVILGSPIYFGDITGEARSFFERFMFQVLNYEGSAFMDSKKKIGCIYTMNAPDSYVADIAGKYEMLFGLFHQPVGYVAATETLQSDKYDRFYVGADSEEYKKARRETQFPVDLKNAFELGKKVCQ